MFEFLNKSSEEILRECEIDTFRSGGPGGQKADVTESGVRLRHPPTGLSAQSQRTRSQRKNRRLALRALRIQYALNVRHEIDLERLRVPESLSNYFTGRLRVNTSNPHYPFVVKLVLDVLEHCRGRVSEAAGALGVTTNQLVSFLKSDDELWTRANRLREQHGLHELK